MVLFVSGLFLSLIVINWPDCVQCEPNTFGPNDADIFQFAALHSTSKQSYFVADRTIKLAEFNAENAVKIWLMVRHGSRTASTKEIDAFKTMENGLRMDIINHFANEKKCPLSKDNWNKLKNWKWDKDFEVDRILTETGIAELQRIATNYKTRFSKLFAPPFDKANFNVISTNTSRTVNSAVVFFDTAIGNVGCSNVLVVAGKKEEGIIKAYKDKVFSKKNEDIENSGNSLVDQFCKTKPFEKLVQEVNERLLFNDTNNKNRVMNMYDLCRYEGIWATGAESVWCSIFTKKELLVLEYAKDLISFTESGPSHELNKKVQCPSVFDMMKHLSHSDGPKVTAYFTHSSAILLHLTAMGAYAQGPPLKPEYNKDSKKREWNTSKLSPMAANFAAVLYKNHTVKFFLNDKVVRLPFKGCTARICDLKSLQSQFKQCK